MSQISQITDTTESDFKLGTSVQLSGSPETLIAEEETKKTMPADAEEVEEAQPVPVSPSNREDETTTTKKKHNEEQVKLSSNGTPSNLSETEIKDIALKLYHEKFLSISPEEYTQFLAAHDHDSAAIRESYMDLFVWDGSLIKATRELCSRLYLKGESQEIDRLLSAFTKSYLKQHPKNVFCTQDFEQIYIILYSLILLNTSLHNSEVKKKSKLSQADYIRNTLTTFLSQNKRASSALSVKQRVQIERELNSYYEDLAKQELYLKKGDSPQMPKKDTSTNRYSIAETIRSSAYQNEHEEAPSPLADRSTGLIDLSRQETNGSTWSIDVDGKPRTSFAMKRLSSLASTEASSLTATTYSHASAHTTNNSRFGFTRALSSDSHRASVASSLRNHRATEQLRNLTRRSSRVSIGTKESVTTPKCPSVDGFSMFSFGEMPRLNLIDSANNELYRLENFDIADFQDPLDLKLELQGAPYLKEGLLKLKILNNDMADQTSSGEAVSSSAASAFSASTSKSGFLSFFSRSNSKDASSVTTLGTNSSNVFSNKFTEYFVVVSKGELRLYSFDPKVIKKQQQKLKKIKQQQPFYDFDEAEEDDDIGDGNWLKNAAHIGNYNLCSTVAQPEKSTGHHSPFIFSLLFPRISKKAPKKFLFEAGTLEVASEFINTCNFWASKLTAVPTLEESVTSIEYGWTDLDSLIRLGDSFKKIKSISKWEALPKGVYLSNLSNSESDQGDSSFSHDGMLKQFVQTLKYYNNLKNLFGAFNRQKAQFMKHFRKFSHVSNYKLVMSNYDNRSQEYKAELNKYKSYITMLGYGLKLRFDLEFEDQMLVWSEEIQEYTELDTPEERAYQIDLWKREAADNESDLTKAVKSELEKLVHTSASMRQLLIDSSHQESRELTETPHLSKVSEAAHAERSKEEEDLTNPSLVKSPKTFSLADFKDAESSPVSQLLSADRQSALVEPELESNPIKKLMMSYSTNTIREEEEPEDDDVSNA